MTIFITDTIYKTHDTGARHPECPARLDAIEKGVKGINLLRLTAKDAMEEDLLRCHSKKYLDIVTRDISSGKHMLSTGDAAISNNSLKAAVRAAGGVLSAVDAILSGKSKRAFCAVRPPGHHAESRKGMGFCIFNNIAIGTRYAQTLGIKKIAIIDWDVHHGNGTQEIFERDPSVFYFSTHQEGIYPGTGSANDKGSNNILNCPILPGQESRVKVLEAFQNQLVPAMKEFKPDLIMISAGFDAHANDPLGSFNLNDADFSLLTQIVVKIANEHSQGRIISVLEGGYDLGALETSVKAHILALGSK